MKADIIVPTFNQEDHTIRCFDSLREYTDNYRLIWADDGSTKESREKVSKVVDCHSEVVKLWSSSNKGFIKNVNKALTFATKVSRPEDTKLIVLLNNDVILTEGWLDRFRRIFINDDMLHAVGPITSECSSWQSFLNASHVTHGFKIPHNFVSHSANERAKILANHYSDLMMPCRMLAFFCTAFRREVFDSLGLLDERFELGYGDDDDFALRMNNASMKLGVSFGSYVHHVHRGTFGTIYTPEEIKAIQAKQHERFEAKHGERARVV